MTPASTLEPAGPPRAAARAGVLLPAAPAVKQILVVDDEDALRSVVARFLRSRGYEVQGAESGTAALDLLARNRFVLMLCDVRMPGMSGTELVPRALAADAELAVVMLTGNSDAPTATEALAGGAYDYLVKPVDLSDLERAVGRALDRRAAAIEQRRIERQVRETVVLRTAEVAREREALRTLTVSVAETLINAMEAKDVYLRGHSQRVAELAAILAEEMELDPDTVEVVRLAGRLHDVGKIGIREAILNKPGRLTAEEFAHVREHVRMGVEILAPLRHLGAVLTYVQHHHEHWDGSGYPAGLAGEDISLGGRILCAADAFDALTSGRAYRGALSTEETLGILDASVGVLLDPRVFAALRRAIEQRQSLVYRDDPRGAPLPGAAPQAPGEAPARLL